jgi:2-iminobutanoate/2-iminopropanoate deaminase
VTKRNTLISLALCLAFAALSVHAQQAKKSSGSQNRTATAKKSPAPPDVEYIARVGPQPLPFSDVVRVGQLLYLSGQLGVDEQGAVVQGGIKAETRQIMERIRRLVEQNNSSMNQVVKCTCMLADMSEWAAMNEVYVTYFDKDRRPARSAFGVNGLARNARVEIECIATVK